MSQGLLLCGGEAPNGHHICSVPWSALSYSGFYSHSGPNLQPLSSRWCLSTFPFMSAVKCVLMFPTLDLFRICLCHSHNSFSHVLHATSDLLCSQELDSHLVFYWVCVALLFHILSRDSPSFLPSAKPASSSSVLMGEMSTRHFFIL